MPRKLVRPKNPRTEFPEYEEIDPLDRIDLDLWDASQTSACDLDRNLVGFGYTFREWILSPVGLAWAKADRKKYGDTPTIMVRAKISPPVKF